MRCQGCVLLAQQTGSLEINAAANRHQRAEVQRFYRRHDDSNHHHIRQYASVPSTVIKIEPANRRWCTCRTITRDDCMALAQYRLSAGVFTAPPGQQFADSFVKGFGYGTGR